MPLFEYTCADCQSHFELLISRSQTAACPDCSSENLKKHLSVFATTGNRSGTAPRSIQMGSGSCGSCGDPRGPGACKS